MTMNSISPPKALRVPGDAGLEHQHTDPARAAPGAAFGAESIWRMVSPSLPWHLGKIEMALVNGQKTIYTSAI